MRIESWRLLAHCRGAKGDKAAALEALESAVSESKECSYVWMEKVALEDMLLWIGKDVLPWEDAAAREAAVVQARIDGLRLHGGGGPAKGKMQHV